MQRAFKSLLSCMQKGGGGDFSAFSNLPICAKPPWPDLIQVGIKSLRQASSAVKMEDWTKDDDDGARCNII